MDFFDVPEVDENDVELIDIHKDDGMAITQPQIPLAPSMIAMQKPLSLEENAEAEDLAGRLNIPAAMVGTDIQKYRKMAQARDIDAATKDSPVFRDWMGQDEKHLSVGMQDTQNILDFERVMLAGPDGMGVSAVPDPHENSPKASAAYARYEKIRNEDTSYLQGKNKWEKAVAKAERDKRLEEAAQDLRVAREETGDWLWADNGFARFYRGMKKGAMSQKAAQIYGTLQGIDETFAGLTSFIPGLSEFFQQGADWAAAQYKDIMTTRESIVEKDKGGELQQFMDGVAENLPQMMLIIAYSLMGGALGGVAGGAKGMAAASPQVAAAMLGRQQAAAAATAGSVAMSSMIYGETYASAREAGSSPLMANLGAIPNAIVQGVLEKFGLEKVVRSWQSTGAWSYIKNSLAALFSEGGVEFVQQFPDDFFHIISLIGSDEGPDSLSQGVSEFVQNLPQTLEGAKMGAEVGAFMGLMFSLPGLRGQARRERLMLNDKAFFDALNDSAKSSALREKLPGMYQDIVSRITENGPVQNVYVSADDLRAAAISLDQDVYELAESIGVSRTELDHAASLGADVEVPLALYQSKVAGTEAGLRLSGKVKTSADGMTLEEMATERQRTVASVVNALREIQDNNQMEADLDEALADIRQGLLDAGHSESQADANLALLKARAKIAAATWSAIKGQQVTPAQWVRDYAGLSLRTEEAESTAMAEDNSPLAQLSNVPLQNAMEGDLTAPLPLNQIPTDDVEILRNAGLVKTYDAFDPETGEKTGTYEGVDKEALFQERDRRYEREKARARESAARQQAQNEAERQAILDSLTDEEREEAKDLSLYKLRKYAQERGYELPQTQDLQQTTLYQNMSTRVPSAKAATEDALLDVLHVSYDVAKTEKASFEKNVNEMAKIPGMATDKTDSEAKAEDIITKMVDNLLWLYDHIDPKIRDRATLWYDGGRKMAEAWGERYGVSPQTVAAVIAVLSPQKNWYENVSMAERIFDSVHSRQGDRWDDAMAETAERIASRPEHAEALEKAKNATLGELLENGEYMAAAIWISVYDETHSDRGFKILTPEGGTHGYMLSSKGTKTNMRWQSYSAIARAISIVMDPRPTNISFQLGNKHKVRNFYNNIDDPSNPNFATIDTHAVAAALIQPLSSSDAIVGQNFGGTGAASSAKTGLSGTYPFYLEAYKRAAEARGILPRQMQSAAWEAVRVLFTDKFKTKSNLEKVHTIWEKVDSGEISIDEARTEIYNLANGFGRFSWAEAPYNDVVSDTYDRSGIEVTKTQQEEKTNLAFEVAPDPNNATATERWNALSDEEKLAVSITVAQKVVPLVLAEFDTNGDFSVQVGGYEGATNPSLMLTIDSPSMVVPIAKMLGYALNQDSMMVISDARAQGTEEVGQVSIQLPDGWGQKEIAAFYDKLWELKDKEGNRLVGGHSTANGRMVILNYSDLTEEELKEAIKTVAPEYEISTGFIYSAFPEKKDYDYGTDRRANRIRSQASEELERELKKAEGRNVSDDASQEGSRRRPSEVRPTEQRTSGLLGQAQGGTWVQGTSGGVTLNQSLPQQRPTTLNQEGLTPAAQTLLQRAFHGSPHRFTQFMLEHIGSGEGAQVHGWGLYFAQNRTTSEGYREKLSRGRAKVDIGENTYERVDRFTWKSTNGEVPPSHLGRVFEALFAFNGNKASAMQRLDVMAGLFKDNPEEQKNYKQAKKWLNTHDFKYNEDKGQLYEVEIPDNDVLLDEQLYFDQQPEKVQDALKEIGKKEGTRRVVELDGEKYIHTPGSPFGNWHKVENHRKLSDDIKQRLDQSLDSIVEEKYTYNIFNNNDSGREIYEKLVRETGSPEAASRALNDAGIKGITYDGRQDGRSFVVFDDKAVQMIDTFYQLQQEQNRPAARGQIEFVGDNEAIITLFKGAADLSTFAHESAHLFMRDLERMAMSSNAPQEIVDDYLALKRWAAPQIEGWYNAHLKGRFGGKAYADLTAEERDAADYVAEQELLAEGFLTYLKEGKAPSQELRSVFGRFRDWLTSIYRAIMGQGFTPVNDEVRAVFDRMLASQQDVAEMEQVHAATDAERAEIDRVGADMLTENERKRLEDARRKAKARASEKTLLDRLRAYFAATGEKKKIEAQAKAEVDAQPVNAAVNDALAAGGISYDSVVEQYGEETAKALAKKRPTLLRKEGGVDISQAAATQDMSPDDLVTGILNAPKKEDAVKAVTDRMLAEREEEIRQEMQEGQDLQPGEEGYYSDDQLSALLIEATALARKAGRKVRTTGNAEANRAWARGILNRMTLSEASVHRLSAAEAKQAAKAAQLLAEGKIEEAADAKRRQAILHAMVLEAVAFRKKLDAFTRKMKRWDRRKKIDIEEGWEYLEQLRALAQRYRIGGRDRFAPDRPQELSRLRDFLKAHDDEDSVFGEAPWSEWLLNEDVPEENGRLKLTVEQYEEIMALGQHLAEGMDPGEAKVISEGLEGTVAELVDKASITLANSGNKFTYREEGTLARKGQDLWKSLFAGLDNAQYILMAADGYEEIGKNNDKQGIHSYLFRLMKEAIGRYGQRYRNALPELQELAVVRENFAKRFEKTYGKRAEQIEGVATPQAMRDVGRPRWTAEHIWCIARNMGNEGNLKTLREGYGLTDEDLINLTSILTREEWIAIQRECELVGASYDETDAVFRKIYGVPMPDRVQPDPITVTCADGTQLDLPGWYFPIAVDTQISPDIGDKQEISAIRDNPDFTALGPAIRRGHTHARTGTGKACALRYEVFESALWDQWRFIEMGPIVKDLDRLTRNKHWRKAFTDAFGPQYYKELREWLKYAARPTQPKKDVIAKLESSLRAKATIFAMGFNVNTFVRQFGGYPQALPDVGFKYLLKGLSYAAMHPIAMWRQINEMSPMMADRDKNFVRELRSHIMKMQKAGVEIGGRKYTSEDVSQAAMSLVTLGDRMTTYPIWQGAYLKAQDKGMSQKDAIAYADGIVSKTQAVAGEADINAWQRDQTGIKRLFTMFMSETLRKGSRMRYWFHALTHGKISVAEYCGHFAAETFGVTMLYLAMRALLSSSEPDPEDVLMALFDEVTGPLPFVNQISGSIQYGRGVGQLSSMKGVDLGVSLIGKTWKWAHKPTDSDAIEGMFKAAVDLTAFELGVGNARRIYRQAAEGWDDISRGKSVNPFRMFIRGFDK